MYTVVSSQDVQINCMILKHCTFVAVEKKISVSPQTVIRATKGYNKKNVSQLFFVVLSSGLLPKYVLKEKVCKQTTDFDISKLCDCNIDMLMTKWNVKT